MPFSRQMDKQTVVCPKNGMLVLERNKLTSYENTRRNLKHILSLLSERRQCDATQCMITMI